MVRYGPNWTSVFGLGFQAVGSNPGTPFQVKEAYYCNNNCIQSDKECLKCWIDKGQRPDYIMKAGETHVIHLYPQWIFVQSKNGICRTLLPASAVSPRAWLLRFSVIILSSCNASGLVPLNDYTLLLSGDKSNRESR